MQKLIETLKSFGIEIPADKQADVKKALSEHYKNIAEHNKAVSKLETDRDTWKEKAETAEETLKSFEGIDPAQVQTELAEWKKKAEDAEKEYNRKIAERDFEDAITAAIKEANGKNTKAIRALLDIESLMKSKNQNEDVKKALDALKEAEDSSFLFVDEAQVQAEQNAVRFAPPFTKARGPQTPPGALTKENFRSMSLDERTKLKQSNPELYNQLRNQ